MDRRSVVQEMLDRIVSQAVDLRSQKGRIASLKDDRDQRARRVMQLEERLEEASTEVSALVDHVVRRHPDVHEALRIRLVRLERRMGALATGASQHEEAVDWLALTRARFGRGGDVRAAEREQMGRPAGPVLDVERGFLGFEVVPKPDVEQGGEG